MLEEKALLCTSLDVQFGRVSNSQLEENPRVRQQSNFARRSTKRNANAVFGRLGGSSKRIDLRRCFVSVSAARRKSTEIHSSAHRRRSTRSFASGWKRQRNFPLRVDSFSSAKEWTIFSSECQRSSNNRYSTLIESNHCSIIGVFCRWAIRFFFCPVAFVLLRTMTKRFSHFHCLSRREIMFL